MSEQELLIAEKFGRLVDNLRGEISTLRAEQQHQRELYEHRIARLERDVADHEQRIRNATDGVTQFKQFSGLAAGGSSIMAVVALIKSFLGP